MQIKTTVRYYFIPSVWTRIKKILAIGEMGTLEFAHFKDKMYIGGLSSAAWCLPGKHKVPRSIPSTKKKVHIGATHLDNDGLNQQYDGYLVNLASHNLSSHSTPRDSPTGCKHIHSWPAYGGGKTRNPRHNWRRLSVCGRESRRTATLQDVHTMRIIKQRGQWTTALRIVHKQDIQYAAVWCHFFIKLESKSNSLHRYADLCDKDQHTFLDRAG